MKSPAYHIVDNGDSAVTIIFNNDICELLTRQIFSIAKQVKKKFANILFEAIPAYQSLTLIYNALEISDLDFKNRLVDILDSNISLIDASSNFIEIPVCYNEPFAPDLLALSAHCGLTQAQVIKKHTESIYLVHMLGFLPGFLYLGGLVSELNCPRKKIPALRVPAGAVGIGGMQTGVYPVESPGGWNIIGRTPMRLFKPHSSRTYLASPLDKIQFISIDEKTFYQLQADNQ